MTTDENLQTGTNSAINYDRRLSPVVLEVIQNDAQIKALNQKMEDLHRHSTPKYVMQTNGELKAFNSEEFDEAVAKIVEQINLRQQQIMAAYLTSESLEMDDQYEEWYAKFEDSINTELAETGADREMDFDIEREFEKRYEEYLNAR